MKFETPEEYAARASWDDRIETGWVRSEGVDPRIVHETENLVHLAGGWTRFDKNNQSILQNRVVYILTKPERRWGIQARFACGAMKTWQSQTDTGAEDLVAAFFERLQEGFDQAAQMVRYPLTKVGVGTVQKFADSASFANYLESKSVNQFTLQTIEIAQNGINGANVGVVAKSPSGRVVNFLILVSKGKDSYQISAISSDIYS